MLSTNRLWTAYQICPKTPPDRQLDGSLFGALSNIGLAVSRLDTSFNGFGALSL